MSWQIDLFRIRQGQDPRKVRDVQYAWEDHPGYAIEEPTDDSDRWIAHVIALLRDFAPDFEEFDEATYEGGHVTHIGLRQAKGPCVVNVWPNSADLRANPQYGETSDGETFDVLWRCCRVLAEEAECAVFPQYDDDPADMTLGVDEGRRIHDWA